MPSKVLDLWIVITFTSVKQNSIIRYQIYLHTFLGTCRKLIIISAQKCIISWLCIHDFNHSHEKRGSNVLMDTWDILITTWQIMTKWTKKWDLWISIWKKLKTIIQLKDIVTLIIALFYYSKIMNITFIKITSKQFCSSSFKSHIHILAKNNKLSWWVMCRQHRRTTAFWCT